MRDTPSVLTFEENLLTTAVGISLFGEVLPPLFFAVGTPLISEGIAKYYLHTLNYQSRSHQLALAPF